MPNRSELRYEVYGATHPAFNAELQGTYRARWRARFAAWWFENVQGGTLWPYAWVVTREVPDRVQAAWELEGDATIGTGAGFGKYTREVSEHHRRRGP